MLDIAGIIRSHQKEEKTVDWLLSLLSQIPNSTAIVLLGQLSKCALIFICSINVEGERQQTTGETLTDHELIIC